MTELKKGIKVTGVTGTKRRNEGHEGQDKRKSEKRKVTSAHDTKVKGMVLAPFKLEGGPSA